MTTALTISEKHARWLEARAIEPEVAILHFGLYSAQPRRNGKGEPLHVPPAPDAHGSVLCFPYMERGEEVATKYRGAGKQFWQRKGGKLSLIHI